ncbi:MAG: metallopeptidase family protein [bacterium]|nr:metallopeptidase family protein [bacterium]
MDGDLDAVLDRLEKLDRDGDAEGLRRTLATARKRYPQAVELREWEATVASDQGRFADALAILDEVLAAEPQRPWARRERAAVLLDLGRFAEALAGLEALPARGARRRQDRLDQASIHADRAVCLDRLGRPGEADAQYAEAARLDPTGHPLPLRLGRAEFERLVADALDDVPERFRRLLDQVVVTVQDWPGPDEEDPLQLGVYVGVARTERTSATADHLDHVVVFQRPHELTCRDAEALRQEVARTVVHEIAHHFGIEHEDMGEYR